jgi:hypothetical protein
VGQQHPDDLPLPDPSWGAYVDTGGEERAPASKRGAARMGGERAAGERVLVGQPRGGRSCHEPGLAKTYGESSVVGGATEADSQGDAEQTDWDARDRPLQPKGDRGALVAAGCGRRSAGLGVAG